MDNPSPPPCADSTGSTIHTETCSCGSANCEMNNKCFASENKCVYEVWFSIYI
jgi:hypothetical protein